MEARGRLNRPTTGILPEMNVTPRPNTSSTSSLHRQGNAPAAEESQAQYKDSFDDMLANMNPKYLASMASHSQSREAMPFSSYPDFSEQNKECHDNYKKDTFQSSVPTFRPKGFKKPQTASNVSDKRWTPLESVTMHDLLWICDQTFVKTATHLSGQLNRSLENEIGASVDRLQTELITPLSAASDAIKDTLHALPMTLDPSVQKSVKTAIGADLALQEDLIRDVQLQLQQMVVKLATELQSGQQKLREGQQQVKQEMCDEMKQLVQELKGEISEMKQTFRDAFQNLGGSFETVQKAHERQCSQLRSDFRNDLQEHVHEKPVKVDWAPIGELSANLTSVKRDVDEMVLSVAAVHKGFMKDLKPFLERQTEGIKTAIEDMGMSKRRKHQGGTDEQGSQTDPADTAEAWIQTGDELIKKSKKIKTMKTKGPDALKPQTRLTTAKNKTFNGPVFASEQAMKQKLRQAMIKKPYNVHDLYHSSGCAQRIARHRFFDWITFFIIFANAIWIAVDADLNSSALLWGSRAEFVIIELIFCVYFTIEVIVRLCAFKDKRSAFRDGWFLFDTFLVVLMIVEMFVFPAVLQAVAASNSAVTLDASILRVLRVGKMIRLSRMARILRLIPELVIVIKAISAAARSLAVICMCIVLLVYIFAVMFRQAIDFLEPEGTSTASVSFGSILGSMATLIVEGVLPQNANLVNMLGEVHPILWFGGMAFVMMTGVTLMYMLVGVMVNVISMVASTEREGMTVNFLASGLREVLQESFDADHLYNRDDFKELLQFPDVIRILTSLDVDVIALLDMADLVYDDFADREARGMTFGELVDLVLNTRGHNTATVQDVKQAMKNLKYTFETQSDSLREQLGQDISSIKQGISNLQDDSEEEEADSEHDDDSSG